MLRKLRRFLGLPPPERRRLLQAFAALARVSLGLRLLGYARCQRWLGRPRSRPLPPPPPEALDRARGYARAVAVAAGNVPFRARCLERSLALCWLLRRRHIPAELRIGVRKAPDLEAHAWVELGGRPVNDGDDVRRRYAAFDRPGVPRSGVPASRGSGAATLG